MQGGVAEIAQLGERQRSLVPSQVWAVGGCIFSQCHCTPQYNDNKDCSILERASEKGESGCMALAWADKTCVLVSCFLISDSRFCSDQPHELKYKISAHSSSLCLSLSTQENNGST